MKVLRPKLKDVVTDSISNRYLVPDLQRDFKWGPLQIRSLLASVIGGQPIGSLLVASHILLDRDSQEDVPSTTLRRVGEPNKKQPAYVLDGQQRLIALMSGFQSPTRGNDPPWVRQRVGLIWALNFDRWITSLQGRPGLGTDDPELIESAIQSVRRCKVSRGKSSVTLNSASVKCLKDAQGTPPKFVCPLWYFTYDGVRSPEFEKFLELFRAAYPTDIDLVERIIWQVRQVRTFIVPVIKMDSCSAMRAAQIFRRINQKGEDITGADLVCSQFFLHDSTLRSTMREMQKQCDDGLKCDSGPNVSMAFAGVFEEDLLRMAVCAGTPEGVTPDVRSDRLLVAVRSKDGVARIREGVSRLQVVIPRVAEILNKCGVSRRDKWPVDATVQALTAALAYHQGIISTKAKQRTSDGRPDIISDARNHGTWNDRLARWWWHQTLLTTASSGRVTVVDLFEDLHSALSGNDLSKFEMRSTFEDYGLSGPLTACPRQGSARPGQSLTLAIECLLRRLGLKDFSSSLEMQVVDDQLDMHHLFPKDWAKRKKILGVDCLANLTLMSAVTNRNHIRALGPREFIEQLLSQAQDQKAQVVKMLVSHGIEEHAYLNGDFPGFIAHRVAWFDARLGEIGGH